MIKSFSNEDLNKLDEDVNAFMSEMKRNLPVRTNSITIPGTKKTTVLHVATVFYDKQFETKELTQQEKNIYDEQVGARPEEKPADEAKGSLWIQKNGSVNGMWKGQKVSIPGGLAKKLDEDGKATAVIKGDKVFIGKNNFKKTIKHPDYYIKSAVEYTQRQKTDEPTPEVDEEIVY